MGPSIGTVLARFANWRTGAVAAAAMLGCVAGLAWRQSRMGGLESLDSRGWYTPDEAAALFAALDELDPAARTVYAATELTLDMAFLAAYGTVFAILLYRLFREWPLFLLALALAGLDALENVAIASLALSYDGGPTPLSWLSAAFTAMKSALIPLTLGAIAIGAARWFVLRLRS